VDERGYSKVRIAVPRKTTIILHNIWNLFPHFIKQSRFLNNLIIKFFIGSWFDIDWKRKYMNVSSEKWSSYYDLVHENFFREGDTTLNQKKEILKNIYGKKVLDVGCGSGSLSILLAKKNFDVTALDCSKVALQKTKKNAKQQNVIINLRKGFLESLPFEDSKFDTIVCCHTLEHVKFLEKSVNGLKRVTKRRIIIIVPRQKYNEYTTDLHTYFFRNKEELVKIIGLDHFRAYYVDGDIFYSGDIN